MQIFPSLAKANGIAPNYINLIESRLQELNLTPAPPGRQ